MQKIQDFFEKNDLTWDIVGSICTDGAPAMMGVRSGFTTLVKQKAPHGITTHCVLHRHVLAAKTLPENLKIVLQKVVKAVNFIRARAMNHRLFKASCDEMGSEHSILLLHTDVRWLSRGLILNRVFKLRTELEIFLRDRNSKLCEDFADPKFIACLGYLSDIFTHLNQVNKQLQGTSVTIVEASEKRTALQTKLDLWARRVHQSNFVNFPNLDEERSEVLPEINEDITKHLKILKNHFTAYFSKGMIPTERWIIRPFATELSEMKDDDPAIEELIDLHFCSFLGKTRRFIPTPYSACLPSACSFCHYILM
ncbi:protein ZBED8-like [Limulus polyphemus]|uniref:Protein ZBED8-like n=1 Tax=Limulus polyphemus TaxID=6850 RepID=A0ABM1B9G4_LIMPO|nr:protein ZBED8-like [Limulus polyphemus]